MGAIKKKWLVKETPEIIRSSSLNDLPSILQILLAQRGYTESDEIQQFLEPKLAHLTDPFLLPDMQAAVERILLAVDRGERILVYGDYDVDGISSVTLLEHVLSAYGNQPATFIPKRGAEGYGLNEKSLERVFAENNRLDLIITVDCGSTSVAEIAMLAQQGIEVIVLDHHEMPEIWPDCCAIVNPKAGEHAHYLCAAGVVFNVAYALMKTRRNEQLDLKRLLELVAIATVADIVPLVGQNRIYVRKGLAMLPHSQREGLHALMRVSDIKGAVSSSDVGFRLGPRINASGRLDDAEAAFQLLRSSDATEAERLAKRLNDYNNERKSIENQMRDEAEQMLADHAAQREQSVIVLGSQDWHPGVVGIVASRLMRRYHKPAFAIAIDEDGVGKGSGRSIDGVNLVEAIDHARETLLGGGGHEMAAGLSIEVSQIAAFRNMFDTYVQETTSEAERQPILLIDVETALQALSLQFLDSYEKLRPFGNENPQPVFMSKKVWPNEEPRWLRNGHVKFSLKQGEAVRDAIFFGFGEREMPQVPWDIVFTIDRNEFRGEERLQILLKDIRSSEGQV